MKFKLKENVTPKINVGDVVVTTDDRYLMIIEKARGTHGVIELKNSLVTHDLEQIDGLIRVIEEQYGLKRIIPGEKITLVEE